MKRCLLLLAACATEPLPVGLELLIDVQVEPDRVTVFTRVLVEQNNGDIMDDGGDGNTAFPSPGRCVFRDDTSGVTSFCFTEVSVDGVEDRDGFLFPMGEISTVVHAGSVLTLKGCRTEETRIPLHASGFPSVDVEVASAGPLHTVSWANPSGGTSLVAGGNGFGTHVCHVAAGVESHTFQLPSGSMDSFYVLPFLPVQVTTGEVGVVRVWRGSLFLP